MAVIGAGRLGTAIAAALANAAADTRLEVDGPLGRGAAPTGVDAVLLCVPDGEIASAAALVPQGPAVGHCSGATGLEPLAIHTDAFSLHPLMTVTSAGAHFAGAGAAVAGSTDHALSIARSLAAALGMHPFTLADEDRAAYHGAASIASNFLVTLEAAAERLAATAGVDRELLVPLVRATVENWAELGAERALTGPVARGDDVTVTRQRAAVAERTPELLPLFDALVAATQALTTSHRKVVPHLSPHSGIKCVRTIVELREALAKPRRQGQTIGLVPTMGALHEGHLSLLRRAREDNDVVVMSLFVNPTQFNDANDLAAYPRDEQRDLELAEQAGVDYVFAPDAAELYPPGFSATVTVQGVTETLEGAHRGREHFDGVTTVVTKLFNIVAPDVAYFGQKDAQQAVVIRKLVRDLNIPIRIEVCPTVREPDGLALSSRNAHLNPAERERATALHQALEAALEAVASGEADPAAISALARERLAAAQADTEYFELVDADTLAPAGRINGNVLAVVAAKVGTTRLIDNLNIDDEVATVLAAAPTTAS